jgi:Fic family protein
VPRPKAATADKSSHRGCAPLIKSLAVQNPDLTSLEIARTVGCSTQNVNQVLSKFLGTTSESELRSFQDAKADIYDALQHKLLASLTDEKISKTNAVSAITGAAILEDKARLVRGQATGINVSVLMDVVEAIKARQSQPMITRVIEGK